MYVNSSAMYVCMHACSCHHPQTVSHTDSFEIHLSNMYACMYMHLSYMYACMYMHVCIIIHKHKLTHPHTHSVEIHRSPAAPREAGRAHQAHALTFASPRHHLAAGDPGPPLLPGGRFLPDPDRRLKGSCQNTQRRDRGRQQGEQVETDAGQSNSEGGSGSRGPHGRRPAARSVGALGAHAPCRLVFAGGMARRATHPVPAESWESRGCLGPGGGGGGGGCCGGRRPLWDPCCSSVGLGRRDGAGWGGTRGWGWGGEAVGARARCSGGSGVGSRGGCRERRQGVAGCGRVADLSRGAPIRAWGTGAGVHTIGHG